MSNLTLRIGGRDFTVACAPGEEAHIDTLGRMIDARLAALGEDQRGLSETRTLLYAALFLADDLHELNKAGKTAPPAADPALAQRIEALAARFERIAAHLEDTGLEDRGPSA